MPLTKKVMVLFDPERYQKVVGEAKRRGCSVGALIREGVDKGILEKAEVSKSTKLEAAARLVSREEEIPEWDRIEKVIAQGHCE